MATFRVCCNSSERRSVPGTSGCAVAASASVLRGKGLRISSDRDLCHAHGSWSGSGVGNRESHRRKSRMVEISLSGSGEGPGWVTSRPTLQPIFPTTGHPVPYGTAGELCCRGYGVMQGYYKKPEEPAKAIDAEGWLHSGDMAILRGDEPIRF